MKLLIAGSRTIPEHKLYLRHKITKAVKNLCKDILDIKYVISGTATGGDMVGEIWARMYDINIKRFPANWKKFGKAAGSIRNEEMAIECDAGIVIIENESSGSMNMIKNLEKHKKPYIRIDFNREEDKNCL